MGGRYRKWATKIGFIWMVITLACNASLPRQQTAAVTLTPESVSTESTALELPPVVVETQPPAGSVLGWRRALTIYFSQPMDTFTVESALSLSPEIDYTVQWNDPATLTITPQNDLAAGVPVTLTIGNTARSSGGLPLAAKYQADFRAADALAVTNQIPNPETTEVDPAAAVMVAFNQPVAPFGSSAEFDTPAIRLEPPVDGWGEWVNTSTYIFHPQPALAGGQDYLVVINKELSSQAGATFGDSPPVNYGFSTSAPWINDFDPGEETPILLDQAFTYTFNQAMLPESVAENMRLLDADGNPVSSVLTWNAENDQVTLTPDEPLRRDARYRLFIGARSAALGGAILREDFAVDYRTVGDLAVVKSNPQDGGTLANRLYGAFVVEFNAPLAEQDLSTLITVTPELAGLRLTPYGGNQVSLWGDFKAGVRYRVELSGSIEDRWGGALGATDSFTFRVLDDEPVLSVPGLAGGIPLLYQPYHESKMPLSATNINSVTIERAELPLADLPDLLLAYWDDGLAYDGELTQWQERLTIERNQSQTVHVNTSPDGSVPAPGLYFYRVTSPQVPEDRSFLSRPFMLVVSPLQVYMKRSPGEVFVWIMRNEDLQPARDLPVRFLYDGGTQIGTCTTGADGTCSAELDSAIAEDHDGYLFAVTGEPGSQDFSIGVSAWNSGLDGWTFGMPSNPYPEEPVLYLYTDRPIYQPGQTVHYKAIIKDLQAGRYLPATEQTYSVKLIGTYSDLTGSLPMLGTDTILLNEFDTADGDFTLPKDAPPGTYSLQVDGFPSYALPFQVAEYRKPEIDLAVGFEETDWLAGKDIQVTVRANYFFGAPADHLKAQYTLYALPQTQYLPQDFQAGVETPFWFDIPDWQRYSPELGQYVLNGEGETDANGELTITIQPGDMPSEFDLQNLTRLTLEVTITDASGQPVSNRSQAWLHPAEFAIGVKTERWVGRAAEALGFLVQTVDWGEQPSGGHALTAAFDRVEWHMRFSPEEGAIYEAVRTPVSSADLVTDAGGRARLVFTPPLSGTYELTVSGGGAVTRRLVWVTGAGQALWPQPPNNELPITSNAKNYRVGDTASVFIPNPFGQGAVALVTMEREQVMAHQILPVDGSNTVVELPLDAATAPNVFVSVTLIGRGDDGALDFRQGYLELAVDPQQQILHVSVTNQAGRMAPGEAGTFEITVTDHLGNPVVGDFSLALVDKAVLALADPLEPGIVEAFYGRRVLRTSNGFSLAASTGRFLDQKIGKGGGGGEIELPSQLRSRFEDTAFWRGSFRTDANGQAQIDVTLPDNLTTWVADVRGITADARVGTATMEVIATKELLLRPVAPTFMLSGDRVQIAAIVHNNTGNDLAVQVSLQQDGLSLEAGSPDQQQVTVPAGGRRRVAWWANVTGEDAVDIIFSARAGELIDQTTPVGGSIPVLRYSRQDTYGTAGVLELPGERVEVITLPRSFQSLGGNLRLELSPSLAAWVFEEVNFGEPPEHSYAENLNSDMLPILAWLPIAEEMGLGGVNDLPELTQRVQSDIDQLVKQQTTDGGWGWWGGHSNAYVSAYITLGLGLAQQRGYEVPADTLARAVSYLGEQVYLPDLLASGESLGRQVFYRYAMFSAGEAGVIHDDAIYAYRSELQPWSKALLAVMLYAADPADARLQTLMSDIEGMSHATATGVYWQDTSPAARQNWSSANFNTAIVLLALAQVDPRSNLVAPAARYLAEQRAGAGRWSSGYERAWALMALSETMRVTGELQADYSYAAYLDERLLAEADLSAGTALETMTVDAPLEQLDSGAGTPLRISRTAGEGRLYYRAFLSLQSAVRDQQRVERGFSVDRQYFLLGEDCDSAACPAVSEVQLRDSAQFILARLDITVPQERYFVVVEDFFPAGSEPVNLSLNTSQIGSGGWQVPENQDADLFADGWGWWYFSQPEIGASSIRWTAEYLPAGNYTLEYRLNPIYAGEFQVMPAHAYELYFPDVEGSSAGVVFTHRAQE